MEGYMMDTQGRQVPVSMVNDLDKLRDQTVIEITQKALQMRAELAAFKQEIRDDFISYLTLSAEKYGKKYGGKKGNVTLMSYDGKYKLILAINESIVFDERLQIAKSIIDDCINKWSEGSRDEIRVLVQDAFSVDRAGNINKNRILGLRRLKIDDPDWVKAMAMISESVQVTGSKEYLRIYERASDGEYRQVPLDVAAL